MHFLVSALGSAGDVLPFIPIAQALQARGHTVRMIALAPFEDRVAEAGIAFTPLGTAEDYTRLVIRPELWHPRRGARLLLDELLRRLPEAHAVTAACVHPGETVLVGSTLSWGMRLVQEQRGLPGATVHLSPFLLASATCPPVLPGGADLAWMPAGLVRVLQQVAERFVLDRWIAPGLDGVRAGLGLPAVRSVWSRWMHSPDLVLGAWPAWFAPPQPDWPAQAQATGFPRFDEGGAALDAGLEAFLDAGPPPVGITPGSAMAHGGALFARALAACQALGQRVVLVSPYREALPRPLPAGVHHVAWAPFGRLLPRLAAMVHHGGIGTSAQALAAGIPQLVVPFAHDQFDNAARLHRLGVAAVEDPAAPLARWVGTLRRLIGGAETADAARRLAQRMAAETPPAQTMAMRLEALGQARL
jgi:rhamnosyltransferase subunit B